jgi:hypothetical protein
MSASYGDSAFIVKKDVCGRQKIRPVLCSQTASRERDF